MTTCGSVSVSSNCNSVDVVKANNNSIEVSSRRPRSTVTVTKVVNNTTLIDDHHVTPGGGVAQSYTHVQASPASTWIVNHNLSYNPAVSIVSSSGDLVHGDVTYSGLQEITINFSAPFSGSVYLS
jgi:hypothetical protein